MKAIRDALRQSITDHNSYQLLQVVDRCQAMGMNYYDMLTAAEHAVPGLDEDQWGELFFGLTDRKKAN